MHATMHLEVVNSNDAPVSTLDPITMSSGMEGQSYGDMLDILRPMRMGKR